MQKILIVTRAFYPLQTPRAYRTTELAKEFCLRGYDVTVLFPGNVGIGQLPDKYKIKYVSFGDLTWKTLIPLKVSNGFFNRVLRKLFITAPGFFFEYPNFEIAFKIKRFLGKSNKKYDLLISIANPHQIHWGIACLWNKKRENNIANVWVADCGDPYMGQENNRFGIKTPFYFGLIEKYWSRKADYITIPINEGKNAYYKEFHSKIRIIPQGFKFSDFQLDKIKVSNPIPTFAYAGLFYKGNRDPSEFLDFLLTLKKDFRFYIFTKSTHLAEHYCSVSNGRIIVSDYIERNELLGFLSKMDFLINFENAGHSQKPSKLIDYLMVEKPVLSIKFKELNIEHINEFLSGDYKNKMSLGNSSDYHIENIVDKFVALYKEKVDIQ